MLAAPILEIAGAFERQLVLQIALDELVIFDELTIEARGCRLGSSLKWCERSCEENPFLGIMTGPAQIICEMFGKWLTCPLWRDARGRTPRR